MLAGIDTLLFGF